MKLVLFSTLVLALSASRPASSSAMVSAYRAFTSAVDDGGSFVEQESMTLSSHVTTNHNNTDINKSSYYWVEELPRRAVQCPPTATRVEEQSDAIEDSSLGEVLDEGSANDSDKLPASRDVFRRSYSPMSHITEFILGVIVQPNYLTVLEARLETHFTTLGELIASVTKRTKVWVVYFIGFIVVGGLGLLMVVVLFVLGAIWMCKSRGGQVTKRHARLNRRRGIVNRSSFFECKNTAQPAALLPALTVHCLHISTRLTLSTTTRTHCMYAQNYCESCSSARYTQ